MTELDGANELVAGSVRVAVTVAALAGEHAARRCAVVMTAPAPGPA